MDSHTPDEPIDVLLIEDNPGDVRLTQEAFGATDSEIEFQGCRDGQEATRYLRQCRANESIPVPDLVLLDLNLPQMDGHSVLEYLEDELDFPLPVLVLSSSSAEQDVVGSYASAANAYLTKPDDVAEFDSMARAIETFWIDTVQHPLT